MSKLSEAELARIAKNRERAKHLRAAKLIQHPYSANQTNDGDASTASGPTKR